MTPVACPMPIEALDHEDPLFSKVAYLGICRRQSQFIGEP